MQFDNITGLWALMFLVPFIIVYLIKPKPKDKVIPSLMFLIRENKTFQQNSFLRKILVNILFFIQLVALCGLAFSVANPIMTVQYNVASENTIFILDSSASMQTKDGMTTRFDKAVDYAKKNLAGKISIISAENMPFLLMEKGTTAQASQVLNKVKPKATTTNIGDALLLANDVLGGQKGRVIVLSDLSQTHGSDMFAAKKQLSAKGSLVEFVDLSNEAENIGIIDLELTKHNAKVYIKNFNENEKEINVELIKDGEVIAENEINILPNSLESIQFETPSGLSQIMLDIDDDLAVDDAAYISAPEKKKVTVLIISDLKKSALISALESSKDIELTKEYFSPSLKDMFDYDVIILNKFQHTPGTFEDLKKYIDKGGNLVITAQQNLAQLDDLGLNPVILTGLGNKTRLCFELFNQFTNQFESNNCPIITYNYFIGSAKNDSVVIASASDGSPLIAYNEKVVYYGIFDDSSDFKTLSSYPIFWNDLINSLVSTENIDDFNYRSGDMVVVDNQAVKTPSSSVTASKIVLDEHGYYEFDGRKIAVNLLNEQESDVKKSVIVDLESSEASFEMQQKTKDTNLEQYLIGFAFLVLLFEIIFLKIRGEL